MNGIGVMIRTRRLALGISQRALADLMSEFGWDQSQVNRLESGNRRLLWDEGCALSDLIGVPAVPSGDSLSVVRDAVAYRRILRTIAEREGEEISDPGHIHASLAETRQAVSAIDETVRKALGS